MENILLIMPSTNPKRSKPDIDISIIDHAYIPHSVLSLAAWLEREGYQVSVLDCRLYDASQARSLLVECLDRVDLVGFSVMTASVAEALELTSLVKSCGRTIPMVWGGVHPTLFPEQTARDPDVDFVVWGEGELPLTRLLAQMRAGNADFSSLSNVAFEMDGQVHFRKKLEFVDPESLPLPAYHLLPMDRYLQKPHFDGKVKRSLELATSRGCPHRCAFCINTIVSQRHWRAWSSKKVAQAVLHLKDRYHLDHILFSDECFFVNTQRVREIAEFMRSVDMTWETDCRADYFRAGMIDDDLLPLLQDSGCIMLRIGAESGSQRVRDLLKKDVSMEDILVAAMKCRDYGIQPMFSYMIGLPTETRSEVIETLEMVSDIQRIAPSFIHSGPQLFRPYPGGELYEMVVQSGYREPKTLRQWAAASPGDFVANDEYPWIVDPEFVFDAIRALDMVDKENTRCWPLSLEPAPGGRRQVIKNLAEFRYRHKFWKAFYEYRILRMIERELDRVRRNFPMLWTSDGRKKIWSKVARRVQKWRTEGALPSSDVSVQ